MLLPIKTSKVAAIDAKACRKGQECRSCPMRVASSEGLLDIIRPISTRQKMQVQVMRTPPWLLVMIRQPAAVCEWSKDCRAEDGSMPTISVFQVTSAGLSGTETRESSQAPHQRKDRVAKSGSTLRQQLIIALGRGSEKHVFERTHARSLWMPP